MAASSASAPGAGAASVCGEYEHGLPAARQRGAELLSRLGDSVVEFLAKPGGRDKLARTSQYALKAVSLTLDARHPLGAKNLYSVKLNGVATGLGHGRRFIRIGNLPAMIKDILTTLREPVPFVRLFSLLSKLSSLGFVFIDHTEWVSRCGVFPMNYEYWAFYASLTWLLGALFGALVNLYLYTMARMRRRAALAKLRAASGPSSPSASSLSPTPSPDSLRLQLAAEAQKASVTMDAQLLDFARNAADLIMASNGVRKIERVPQVVFPLFGLVSSVIGSYQAWPSLL